MILGHPLDRVGTHLRQRIPRLWQACLPDQPRKLSSDWPQWQRHQHDIHHLSSVE